MTIDLNLRQNFNLELSSNNLKRKNEQINGYRAIAQEYYNDKNYYLKVAEYNNLSSFRKLKTGSNLEFPPIKK